MSHLVWRARNYLAANAAESGADVLIAELADEVETLTLAEREACAEIAETHEKHIRDYSREVFARAIASKIRSRTEAERNGVRDAFRSLIAAVEQAGFRVYHDITKNTYSVRLRQDED